jgi:hypothetical protein
MTGEVHGLIIRWNKLDPLVVVFGYVAFIS